MAQEEIELIRDWVRNWNQDGVEAIEPFLDPHLEWIDPPELPGGGVHHGREATMASLREWTGALLTLTFELNEIVPCPDGHLVISTAHGTGAGGVPVLPHQWFHWVKWKDGKLIRAKLFLERGAALEAVGLSEERTLL